MTWRNKASINCSSTHLHVKVSHAECPSGSLANHSKGLCTGRERVEVKERGNENDKGEREEEENDEEERGEEG